eukprot:CAMPEP_0206381926 /NCGR_PEP_ID=MMETSP0294-20121207/12956_1 /ASSEMBLY_ACC=CAM_ASM_000327 /TAXON_ID=39354 /ORGANISM="Heterosigma akashiwo, Strain CCMP2393" /LENGTH=361 /DNA_ID=CAMNT_0053831511 /DNA_START=128 /DNA_END=1210 /DNA_ORIENTATION=-
MVEAVAECMQFGSFKNNFQSNVDDSSEGHIQKKPVQVGSECPSAPDRLAIKFSESVRPCNQHLILRFADGLRFEEWEQPLPLVPPEIGYEDDGDIELTRWRRPLETRAAENGHLPILQWLHNTKRLHGCPREAMDRAIRRGHLAVVEWLHTNRFQRDLNWSFSVTKANLHVAEWWLHVKGPSKRTKWIASEAVCRGHLSVLEWLHRHDLDLDFSGHSMNLAERNGHLSVVEFLHSMHVKPNKAFPSPSQRMGTHLPMLEWLHKICSEKEWLRRSYSEERHSVRLGAHWVITLNSVMASAAEDGNLALVKWLHSKHVKTNSKDNISGAFHGIVLVKRVGVAVASVTDSVEKRAIASARRLVV